MQVMQHRDDQSKALPRVAAALARADEQLREARKMHLEDTKIQSVVLAAEALADTNNRALGGAGLHAETASWGNWGKWSFGVFAKELEANEQRLFFEVLMLQSERMSLQHERVMQQLAVPHATESRADHSSADVGKVEPHGTMSEELPEDAGCRLADVGILLDGEFQCPHCRCRFQKVSHLNIHHRHVHMEIEQDDRSFTADTCQEMARDGGSMAERVKAARAGDSPDLLPRFGCASTLVAFNFETVVSHGVEGKEQAAPKRKSTRTPTFAKVSDELPVHS